MIVIVHYNGARRKARLSGARFIHGELFVTALIEGFRFEKELHWSHIR